MFFTPGFEFPDSSTPMSGNISSKRESPKNLNLKIYFIIENILFACPFSHNNNAIMFVLYSINHKI